MLERVLEVRLWTHLQRPNFTSQGKKWVLAISGYRKPGKGKDLSPGYA